ncbi:Xaa-Pro aminopeptidase [Bacteroidales bacterium OttesenSCG-928-I21]|nr:Xaa-Pro aminopeptidase [Bacteroidales bacterium OttesenSCG-928-I21]
MTFLDKAFFCNNRIKLYNLIDQNSLIILCSADQYPRNGNQFFKYRQNSDIYYFSGLQQEDTILILHKNEKKQTVEEYAFIIKSDEKMLTWTGHKYTTAEVTEISGIQNVEYLENFDSIFGSIIKSVQNVYFSFSGNIRVENQKNSTIEKLAELIKEKFPLKNIQNLDSYSHFLRLTKEPQEIETIKKACAITGNSFASILKFVKPNIYEYQVEAEITRNFLSAGSQGFAYLPIVASGQNSCVLHYITNREMCKTGDLLLLDFGAELDNYASDVSRTIPISGKYTKRQKEVYNSVLNVMKQIKQKFVVGNNIVNLNKECAKLIEEELLNLGLLKKEDISAQSLENPAYKKYFMHGVSHYMGLDIHDVGDRKANLMPGMILSCEPGIYIPEEGFGIRLENDILITETTPIDICEHIPIEIEEIEYAMNNKN